MLFRGKMPDIPRRPKKGERYEIIETFEAGVLTQWRAPFTGGYDMTLPSGLQFIIVHDPAEGSTGIAVHPDPYHDWEKVLVTPEDRAACTYDGYYIVVSYDDIEVHCRKFP
jgi:hypothetical protein